MAAAKGPVVLDPSGRYVNRENWRNDNWQEVPEYSEKNRSQCYFVQKYHKSTALESKPGLQGEKPGISHGRKPLIWTLRLLKKPTIFLALYTLYFEKKNVKHIPSHEIVIFQAQSFLWEQNTDVLSSTNMHSPM